MWLTGCLSTINIGKYTDVGVTSSQAATCPGYDYGNAAADIDPESIKSINILKGSAATAYMAPVHRQV